jgi:hypothetical protein
MKQCAVWVGNIIILITAIHSSQFVPTTYSCWYLECLIIILKIEAKYSFET